MVDLIEILTRRVELVLLSWDGLNFGVHYKLACLNEIP